MNNFKYLGTKLNSINDNHKVKKHVTLRDKCFYALTKLFRAKLISKKSIERLIQYYYTNYSVRKASNNVNVRNIPYNLRKWKMLFGNFWEKCRPNYATVYM